MQVKDVRQPDQCNPMKVLVKRKYNFVEFREVDDDDDDDGGGGDGGDNGEEFEDGELPLNSD